MIKTIGCKKGFKVNSLNLLTGVGGMFVKNVWMAGLMISK